MIYFRLAGIFGTITLILVLLRWSNGSPDAAWAYLTGAITVFFIGMFVWWDHSRRKFLAKAKELGVLVGRVESLTASVPNSDEDAQRIIEASLARARREMDRTRKEYGQ